MAYRRRRRRSYGRRRVMRGYRPRRRVSRRRSRYTLVGQRF